jgi:hypothetical protein
MAISSGVLCFPYLAKRWAVARPIRVRSHRNYIRSCAAFLLARALLLSHFPCHGLLPSSLCILCVTIRCITPLGPASPACVPPSPSTTFHGTWQKYTFRSCMYHRLGTLSSSACFPPPSCSPLGLRRPCDHLHPPPATPMGRIPILLAPNWPLSVAPSVLTLSYCTNIFSITGIFLGCTRCPWRFPFNLRAVKARWDPFFTYVLIPTPLGCPPLPLCRPARKDFVKQIQTVSTSSPMPVER